MGPEKVSVEMSEAVIGEWWKEIQHHLGVIKVSIYVGYGALQAGEPTSKVLGCLDTALDMLKELSAKGDIDYKGE